MIPTIRLLTKIDLKLNKIGTSDGQEIPLPEKLLFINEAQVKLVKKKIGLNNIYGIGLDGFKKRYEDLEDLVVEYEKLIPVKDNSVFTTYSAKQSSLKNKYFLPISLFALCSRKSCTGNIVIVEKIVKHADALQLCKNPHEGPSFDYQATIATISSGSFIIYANDPRGDFKVDELHVSYLRYPVKIDFEGYEDFDGSPSATVDCELPDYLEDELVDLAVQDIALSINDSAAAQASQIRNKESE